MKKVCCIIGWTAAAVVVTYLAGQLLLLVLFHLLGITIPHGKLIQALPPAVALVLRWVGTLIQAVVVIVTLTMGVKCRLPGTHNPATASRPDVSRPV